MPDDRPRWLSPSEQAAWLCLGALVTRLPAALEADLQRSTGLALFDYLVLSGLSEAPGRTMRMSELSGRVSSSPSRLSHGVARLERRGWVRRAPWEQDGRHVVATLTDDGYDELVRSAPEHVRSVRALVVDALSPEQLRQLHDISRTVLASLDAPTAGPVGDRPSQGRC